MIKEEWRIIKDFPNYMISNYGRIKNINYRNTGKEKLVKGTSHNDYVYITLRKNNKSYIFLLHRLVAQTFLPNIENKPCVNHIDCNRSNNNVSNLEWCTQKENIEYMDSLKRRVANKKLTNQDVKQIKQEKVNGKYYKEVWKQFSDKITLSGFEKVWYGQNWK